MNVVLTGFMATGKTSVARILSDRLGMEYIDTDSLIEAAAGISIPDIFREKGEARFREMESDVIRRVSERDNCVISTGGGAVLKEENMEALERRGIVVCLTASPDVIYRRTQEIRNRPLLEVPDPLSAIKGLMEKRMPFYKRCSLMVDTSGKIAEETARMIEDHLSGMADFRPGQDHA